jgi:hypothetical protein
MMPTPKARIDGRRLRHIAKDVFSIANKPYVIAILDACRPQYHLDRASRLSIDYALEPTTC